MPAMFRVSYLVLIGSLCSVFGLVALPGASAIDVQGTVTLLGICGVTPTVGSPIVYGILAPYTESTDKTLTITNAGNVQAAITVKGTAWDGVLGGSGVMLTGATHYSMTASQAYASKTALTGSEASLTTLNPLQIKNSFWQLKTDLTPAHADFIDEAVQTVTLTAGC
jgi:hypothetical protein